MEAATSAQVFACRGVLEVNIIVNFGGLVVWFSAAFAARAKHLEVNCDEPMENVYKLCDFDVTTL
jgi:hypothetical protein